MAEFICNQSSVQTVLTIGVTSNKIEQALIQASGEKPQVEHCQSLEAAVRKAASLARQGEIVLLSPACASYDMFPNFQVRGQVFKELVEGLG